LNKHSPWYQEWAATSVRIGDLSNTKNTVFLGRKADFAYQQLLEDAEAFVVLKA
jgi:hypothetical protein